MPIGEICSRDVVVADRSVTVSEAARLMRQHHVGTIVLVEGDVDARRPVGIVTDRDIVIGAVAGGLDAEMVLATEIIGDSLVTVREREGVSETVRFMCEKGVRRIPVVGEAGNLVGIVSVDDLVDLLAEEMGELSRLIGREQAREARNRK